LAGKTAEAEELVKDKSCPRLESKIVKRIHIPKKYHEGLFLDGNDLWVCNGEGGDIWVVDNLSGEVKQQIKPIADFTEAITKKSEGLYFTTEWKEKKLYLARVSGDRLEATAETSVAPAHPAGAVWTGDKLYVIAWTRGMGTKFDLLEFDGDMSLLRTIHIKDIQEPCQMSWDGRDLWISSWFDKTIYRVDPKTFKITGQVASPADRTTGICRNGKYMYLTGTYSDLYKIEILQEADMQISVTSNAFKNGGMIPAKYTCDGDEVSPPLSWSGVPSGAMSVALISDDPDAPNGDWVHWVMFNIPPDEDGLPEAVPAEARLANGAAQGIGTGGETGYASPCPPSGTHRYYFKVYALDRMLDLGPGVTKAGLLKAMEGHILAKGELMGRYKR